MTTATPQPTVTAPPASPDVASRALDTDAILRKLDDTLDLIAHANGVAAGSTPCDRIDVSVLVPVRNARHTIPILLDRIDEVMPPATEVIVIDDASDDGTAHFIRGRLQMGKRAAESEGVENPQRITKLLRRRRPHGRGSALRMGIRHSRGHVVAIQNADPGTDPADLLAGVWPILEDRADAVYGVRGGRRQPWLDRFATGLVNHFADANLSDLTHGQKVFRGDVLRSLKLSDVGEAFDAEVTRKFLTAIKHHRHAVGCVMECSMPHALTDEPIAESVRRGFTGRFELIRAAWQR